MFKITYRTTRESTKAFFFKRDPEVAEMLELYRKDGLFLKEESAMSPDRLTRVYSMYWISKEYLAKFNNESVVKEYSRAKQWYDTQNDHVTNIITKEVDNLNE